MVLKDLAFADVTAAVFILPLGPLTIQGSPPQKINMTDALFVGRSTNGCSATSKPSLSACLHYSSHCGHLGPTRRGVVMPAFASGANMGPRLGPWNSVDSYPAFGGSSRIERATFARYGKVPFRDT